MRNPSNFLRREAAKLTVVVRIQISLRLLLSQGYVLQKTIEFVRTKGGLFSAVAALLLKGQPFWSKEGNLNLFSANLLRKYHFQRESTNYHSSTLTKLFALQANFCLKVLPLLHHRVQVLDAKMQNALIFEGFTSLENPTLASSLISHSPSRERRA